MRHDKGEVINEIGKGNLIAAVRQLQEVMHRAQALGLFIDDRDLLECPSCGLREDVTAKGLLVVYQKDDPSQEDSGLRFKEIDESHFVCPACGDVVTIENEDFHET
jgi:predicted RNA-binding Zn-ribbon protein involved in translation (DUF1610 family)